VADVSHHGHGHVVNVGAFASLLQEHHLLELQYHALEDQAHEQGFGEVHVAVALALQINFGNGRPGSGEPGLLVLGARGLLARWELSLKNEHRALRRSNTGAEENRHGVSLDHELRFSSVGDGVEDDMTTELLWRPGYRRESLHVGFVFIRVVDAVDIL